MLIIGFVSGKYIVKNMNLAYPFRPFRSLCSLRGIIPGKPYLYRI